MKKLCSAALGLLLLLSLLGGCGGKSPVASLPAEKPDSSVSPESIPSSENRGEPAEAISESSAPERTAISSDMFTDRDLRVEYDDGKAAHIFLEGNSIRCDSNAVSIEGSTAVIRDEGVYVLSGTLTEGQIVVDAEKQDKLQLVLHDASVTCAGSAALYVKQADKVFLTLAEDTENTLSNGGSFESADDPAVDAAVFSREDLTINGSGKLTVTSPVGHGIVSKDDLVFTGGVYEVSAASQGLSGKDSVRIAGGDFTVTSGKDGIHSENQDDDSKGFVYIEGGEIDLVSEGDGVSASSQVRVLGGNFTILAGGGSENGTKTHSDQYGMFPEGDRFHGGFMKGDRDGFGGKPNGTGGREPGTPPAGSPGGGFDSMEGLDSTDESTSMKGIKAGVSMELRGGVFQIDSADDALHSNGSMIISGGTFTIAAGDDGVHADDTLTVTGGSIQITESYEGLEAQHLEISDGNISLVATDDGLNAAGGMDQSGMGGRDGGRGGMFSAGNGTLIISGGNISIQASGDGIDANGTLAITGGNTVVCGPVQGDTATLDYDVSGTITGGTFIGTGSSFMAQTFSDSAQGVIAVSTGGIEAGTRIELTDAAGTVLLSCEPALAYDVVILSSPELVKGNTYTLSIGDRSSEITAK